VGSVVAGTYEIVRMLGRGGMGAVWEAHHQRLPGKRVAIKVLHASVAEDPESLARFRREAEIACRLGHANIVEVHDFNKLDDGSPYLILELLEGTSLDERLQEGPLSLSACESILRQIGSALQCAHAQGVVHRDLKPQNIFLVPSPTGVGPEIVKVLDFGISKIRGSQTVKTQDSTLLGTPQYMAPEQATGQHDKVDARTDIFALGSMLYELLSGTPAYSGQNIPEVVYKVVHVQEAPLATLVKDIPADKAAAVHKALKKEQDERFASVDEFVLAFSGEPLPPPRKARSTNPREASDGLLASAATVDSSKIDLEQAQTVASHSSDLSTAAREAVAGVAATIDSSKIDKDDLESIAAAAANAAPVLAPTTRSRTLLIALLALLGLGAVAYVVLQREDSAAAIAVDAAPVMTAQWPPVIDAAAALADVFDASPSDAALPDAALPDAATKVTHGKSQHIKRGQTDPQTTPSKALPPKVKKLLNEAQAHAEARQWGKVIKATRAATRLFPTDRAYMLQALAFCHQGAVGAFNGALRNLPPGRQRRAQKLCDAIAANR